jgi:hypothetical protein
VRVYFLWIPWSTGLNPKPLLPIEIRAQIRIPTINNTMKLLSKTRRALLLAAVNLPLAFQLDAQQTSPLVGPRPSKAGDERIVRSTAMGYLRVYTPEMPVYPVCDDDAAILWKNENYRIVPKSGGRGRTWFHRRPLALNPGIYDVEVPEPAIDVVFPRDDNHYEKVRVLIKPGRITEVWLNDSDRPKFTSPTSSTLVHDNYGDIIGYRNNWAPGSNCIERRQERKRGIHHHRQPK